MSRLVKFLLILIAAFVGIGIAASAALYLFFDPNDFRDDISAGVLDATGRELLIEGDISLSVFPWIAVEVGRTELGNAAGFADVPMLSFENARLSVRFLPLVLRREIAIGTASLDGLTVNLAVAQNGRSNWDDLVPSESGRTAAPAEPSDGSGGATKLDVGDIRVTNANLSYRDAQAGTAYALSELSVSTGSIEAGSPFDLKTEFDFSSSPGEIGGHLSVAGTLTLAGRNEQLDIDGLNIHGQLSGVVAQPTDFNFDARAINVNLVEQQLTLGEMDLAVLGLTMAADIETFSYAGTPKPRMSLRVNEFSLKELLRTLGSEPPETADPNAMQRVAFSANAALGDKALALTDMTLQLDDTTMTGSLALPTTAGGKLGFDLKADSISLDPYMAPAGSGDATAAEAADDDIEIPTDLIRALNVSGTVRLGQAFLSGMTFDNMQLGINAAGGKLRLHPISAELFDGTYKGDVRIDASGATPALSVNENISGVSLKSLARSMFDQDNITGTINGSFVLGGSGPSLAAIRQDLDGKMSFELIDGAFEGTDVWHQLRSARATFKHEPVPEPRLPARTEFTSVTASGTVTDGVFSNNDLLAELPFLRLTGGGVVNLVAANMDYAMQVRVLDRPEFVDQATEAELADFSSAVIPLKISGPLASPSIRPDLEALVRQEVERQVEEKKEELTQQVLDQIFGEEPAEDAEAPAEDGEQPEEEKSAEDQVKDALRNIFKR